MNRRSLHRLGACALTTCMALALGFATGAEQTRVPIAIIVSAHWDSVSQVSIHDLRRIYLGNTTKFAGAKVEPVDQAVDSAIYHAFLIQVVNKSRKVLADYWLEQVLTGGLRPPRQLKDSRTVIDFVARTEGAIGYVRLDDLAVAENTGVKILSLVQADGVTKPSQPEYALRLTNP